MTTAPASPLYIHRVCYADTDAAGATGCGAAQRGHGGRHPGRGAVHVDAGHSSARLLEGRCQRGAASRVERADIGRQVQVAVIADADLGGKRAAGAIKRHLPAADRQRFAHQVQPR